MGLFNFWRKPAPPSEPPFVGGECHFARGDEVVALEDRVCRGGKIVKGAVYVIDDVCIGLALDDSEQSICLHFTDPASHWESERGIGLWDHFRFRKVLRISDGFREKLLAPIPAKPKKVRA